MGTEYAFVDDHTGEAYDLGRGPWYEWKESRRHTYDDRSGPPATQADVDALLIYYQQGWALGLQPAWATAVGASIWAFLASHPNARIVYDGEAAWGDSNGPLDEICRRAGMPVFRQVGSTYDHDDLLVRPVLDLRPT